MFGRKARGLSEPPVESCGRLPMNGEAAAAKQAKLNRLSATYGLSGSQNDLNNAANNGQDGPHQNGHVHENGDNVSQARMTAVPFVSQVLAVQIIHISF